MYYLYKLVLPANEIDDTEYCILKHYIKDSVFLPAEKFNIRTLIIRLYFKLISRKKATIYYATSSDAKIIHTSYVIPCCGKFPFMSKDDCEIGPCYTAPEYRGRGIYVDVLKYITTQKDNIYTRAFMIVDSENKPSIHGIERAGFVLCGKIYCTKITKRYKLVED